MATSASKPTASNRALIIVVLKWLLAMALLGGLFWQSRDNLADLQNRQILWSAFAIALGIRFFSLLATFSRWRLLVRGIGLPFSLRETFRLGMMGEACNLMGPGAVGGDLVKAALLAKDHPKRIASVMSTVFLDRVLGMWSLFMLGAFASLSPVATKPDPEFAWTLWVLWGGTLAGLIGIVLMFIPSFTHSRLMHWLTTWKFVGRIVKELMDSIQLYQGKPHVVIGAVALGLLGHLGFLTSFYFCAQSLHQGQVYPGFIDHVVGLPLPEAVSAVAPLPGGAGALEGAVGWFYWQHQKSLDANSTEKQLKAANDNGFLTTLIYRLTTFIMGAIGLVWYFSSKGEIQKAMHDVETDPQVIDPNVLTG